MKSDAVFSRIYICLVHECVITNVDAYFQCHYGVQFVLFYHHSHALNISKPDFLLKYYKRDFLMPTTKKQKKARKCRGAEMLSDIANLDFIVGGNHLEREGSEFSDSIRRPDSPNYDRPEKK